MITINKFPQYCIYSTTALFLDPSFCCFHVVFYMTHPLHVFVLIKG